MKKDESLDQLLERAARPRAGTPPPGSCLDTETLAAWTDGSLSDVQRAAAETHAADCDRCLAVLAAIARTAPPPSVVQRPAWLSIRWLVPLATAAVLLVAVVMTRGPRESDRETVALPSEGAAPATSAAPVAPPAKDAATDARAAAPEQRKKEASGAIGSETLAKSRRAEESPAKRPDSLLERKTVDRIDVRPQPSAPPAASAAAGAAAPPPAQERLESQSLSAFRQLPAIVSPDANIQWRIAGSNVERSTDGGRTWILQSTGTDVPLLTGFSPSPSVCWIAGRSGVVLLSTDAVAWRRADIPDPKADLVRIVARDALSATVTTADGRTYHTDDGGRSWTLQEKPAAAF
jgi:hypothetical protein